jgi:hypothetical protein
MANPFSVEESCGTSACFLAAPSDVYRTPDTEPPATHVGVRFRARLFRGGSGSALGAEIPPCPGCTNDDETQTYTFEIPARTSAQGAPLDEHLVLTFLRPTLPAGAALSALMAPQDAGHPDSGATYGEFLLNSRWLTGRLVGAPGPEDCVTQRRDPESRTWICTSKARAQLYRALLSTSYRFQLPVESLYGLSPTPTIAPIGDSFGTLEATDSAWSGNAGLPIPFP